METLIAATVNAMCDKLSYCFDKSLYFCVFFIIIIYFSTRGI